MFARPDHDDSLLFRADTRPFRMFRRSLHPLSKPCRHLGEISLQRMFGAGAQAIIAGNAAVFKHRAVGKLDSLSRAGRDAVAAQGAQLALQTHLRQNLPHSAQHQAGHDFCKASG